MPGVLAALLRGGPLLGARRRLGERLRRHWINFVHHGAPGQDWPRYEPDARKVKIFNADDSTLHDPDAGRRLAWAGMDIMVSKP
jgi:para-nitrobenzyl esterase